MAVHHHDVLAKKHGFRNIVRHKDAGRTAALPQRQHGRLEVFAGQGVEGRKRLVHKQDVRIRNQGPAYGDALPLASRELRGIAHPQAAQPQFVQHVRDGFPARGRCDSLEFERQGQVLLHRLPRKEPIILQDERNPSLVAPADFPGTYRAPVRLVQPREEVEQGAFAASRRADDGKGFPGGQIKGKAVQNRAFAVALAQITDGDARIGRTAH